MAQCSASRRISTWTPTRPQEGPIKGRGFDGLTTGVVRSYVWTATAGGKGVYRRRLEQNDAHVYRFSNPPTGFAIVVRCVKG